MKSNGDTTDYENPTLTMIEFPAQGPPRIVPVTSDSPYKFIDIESKQLFRTGKGQAAGQELVVYLVCDGDGIYTQKGNPNKHIPGLFGPCYLMCMIESTASAPENEEQEWPEDTFRIGERIPHEFIARVIEEFTWKQNVVYSPYHGYFHHVLGEAVRKYEKMQYTNADTDTKQITNVIWRCLCSMEHPHIERTTIAAVMITPEHPDVLIKSTDGLTHALESCMKALAIWAAGNGAAAFLSWERDTIPDEMPESLPNPSLTCKQVGAKLHPVFVARYANYFSRLDAAQESEAEAQRRKAEAERRDREAAAKRASENAKKAKRLLKERIARLEAEASRPYTDRGAQRLPQKSSTSRGTLRVSQVVHDHHVSNDCKAQRTVIWEAKQEMVRLTAEANRLEKAYMEMRNEEKRQGAAAALRNQVTPGKATVASFVPDLSRK